MSIDMREFMVADLNTRGELRSRQSYSYQSLEMIRGASELIVRLSTALWREPTTFTTALGDPADDLRVRWAATADTSGIATIWSGDELMTLSLLACGVDTQGDAITLQAFQSRLLHELHDSGIEPAFDLIALKERPLIATINFRSPKSPAAQQIVALADRCFAASYFRCHGLA
jgi:hypothetical protein